MLTIILAACRTGGSGSVELHYIDYGTPPPEGNRVTVCHGYSCKLQTAYKFAPEDIAEIAAIMKQVRRDDTPSEERRAVAYAIGAMETKVGSKLGINDRPGMQWGAAGRPSQQ